jgi:hypothetical protein
MAGVPFNTRIYSAAATSTGSLPSFSACEQHQKKKAKGLKHLALVLCWHRCGDKCPLAEWPNQHPNQNKIRLHLSFCISLRLGDNIAGFSHLYPMLHRRVGVVRCEGRQQGRTHCYPLLPFQQESPSSPFSVQPTAAERKESF